MATLEFRDFITRTLSVAIPKDQIEILTSDGPLTEFFLKAFTHKTFIHPDLKELTDFNYEILEKLGDRVLNASFQMWMYDVIGAETNMLQPYSDIDKRYTGTDYLNILADNVKFSEHVFYVGEEVTKNMKEDVFEAFVGALVLAGDKYVSAALGIPYIGFTLAKRWVYSVLNVYLRPKIDISDVNKYVDKRSRVNEIWHFNNWGTAVYLTPKSNSTKFAPGKSPSSKSPKSKSKQASFTVTFKSPNAANLPLKWRNITLGVGTGQTLALAKEEAAVLGLQKLEQGFLEIVKTSPDVEVRYEYLNLGKVRRWLTQTPAGAKLYNDLLSLLLGKSSSSQGNDFKFENVLARVTGVKGGISAQIRVKINGSWKNEFRGHGVNDNEAVIDAITQLLQSVQEVQPNRVDNDINNNNNDDEVVSSNDENTNDEEKRFVEILLARAFPEQAQTLSSEPASGFFRDAFVNKSYTQWKEDMTWIYSPLEKIGKKVFDACFQLWLHEVIGDQTVLLQAYSDIEQRFTGEEYLSELSDSLQITTHINIGSSGNSPVIKDSIKMTAVHSFVGAIVLSADKYIVKDYGLILARLWVSSVLDSYLKDRIDVTNTAQYTNKVMAIDGIWLFKNWGPPIYRVLMNSDAVKETGVSSMVAVDFVAPNVQYFPEKYKNKLIGSGVARNLVDAKLIAAEMGLNTLGINYVELKNSEVQFDRFDANLTNSKIKQLLSFDPNLFKQLMEFLQKNKSLYTKISIRYLRIGDRYSTQIRKQNENREWENVSRSENTSLPISLLEVIARWIAKSD